MNEFFDTMPTLIGSVFNSLLGEEDTRSKVIKRQAIARKTYMAMLPLWDALNAEIDSHASSSLSLAEDSPVQKALNSFHEDMKAVYAKFEKGESYAKTGLLEKWSNYFSKQLHRNIASNTSLTKELQYELEKFWDSFFSLEGAEEEREQPEPSAEERETKYFTEVSANRIRKGYAEANADENLQYGRQTYQPTSTKIVSRYINRVNRKIGLQLTGYEAMMVATSVVNQIIPDVMETLVDWYMQNWKAENLLNTNPTASQALVRMHLLDELRTTIEHLVSLDEDYQTLMDYYDLETARIQDLMILNTFNESADLEGLEDSMYQTFERYRTSENMLLIANRSGGVPLRYWDEDNKNFARAAKVFVNRILQHKKRYEVLIKQFEIYFGRNPENEEDDDARSESMYWAVMDNLKEVIILKVCIEFEESLKGWAFKRLYSHLEIEGTDHLDNVAAYTAEDLGVDIGFQIQSQILKQLANENMNGFRYFADVSIKKLNEAHLKHVLEAATMHAGEWWPWGMKRDQDFQPADDIDAKAKQFIFPFVLKDEERPDLMPYIDFDRFLWDYRRLKNFQMPAYRVETHDELGFRVGVRSWAENAEEVEQAQKDATPKAERLFYRLFAELFPDTYALDREQFYLALNQAAIDIANDWVNHYAPLAEDDLLLRIPKNLYEYAADGKAFAKKILGHLQIAITEIIQTNKARYINAADFGAYNFGDRFTSELSENIINFIFYKNIAVNLEQIYMQYTIVPVELLHQLQEESKVTIENQLKTVLPNEIRRICPDLKLDEAFDQKIQYDPSTFNGLMANFYRNIIDILERRNLMKN